MPGAGSNRINEFGFYTNYYTLPIGNIAHTPAMWQSVFKAVMQMRKEQYRADMLYQVSLSVAKTMRAKGLITADEYAKIDTMLLAKYQPYLGRLLSENA